MKRLLMVVALCVMTFWSSTDSAARGFGVTAGASFLNIDDVKAGATTGYHAGLTYKFDLPLGFAIQPSVLYHVKGSVVEDAVSNGSPLDLKTGFVEVPLSLQWGPDLILFRPFLDVTPFVGYGITNSITKESLVNGALEIYNKEWDGINRLEYGLGVGVGLDIWKFQVIGRYNWNFGNLLDASGNLPDKDSLISNIQDNVLKGQNYGGVTLSLAFIF